MSRSYLDVLTGGGAIQYGHRCAGDSWTTHQVALERIVQTFSWGPRLCVLRPLDEPCRWSPIEVPVDVLNVPSTDLVSGDGEWGLRGVAQVG